MPEQLTLFAGEIHAKPTVMPEHTVKLRNHRLIISSGLLLNVALALFSGKILPSLAKMPLGLGGESAMLLKKLATLCCPSASERVALAFTTGETACSCSVSFRSPNARD